MFQIVDFLRKIIDKIIDFRQRLQELLKIAPDRGFSKENHKIIALGSCPDLFKIIDF